mmetsp:Transcript_34071/g.39721  ORF Transcript_34071/g.39721 Transcript_34071/m.39721 type:complete len:207 (-) Transcript_34071:164-784(-)|eukprot:CAMPEP_0176442808 /NCGR_PEP_ID=MMETSP0127-20121128/22041_1 /TAXON_ID=938130 /ORGANISM="Platyophrya macrostoma, Strain WH" /LENGTH=206 /DNA_ID=CAMNT_0017827903 /DNA_START=62 /DNA_END=682 /DNA_ORIENTATION=+
MRPGWYVGGADGDGALQRLESKLANLVDMEYHDHLGAGSATIVCGKKKYRCDFDAMTLRDVVQEAEGRESNQSTRRLVYIGPPIAAVWEWREKDSDPWQPFLRAHSCRLDGCYTSVPADNPMEEMPLPESWEDGRCVYKDDTVFTFHFRDMTQTNHTTSAVRLLRRTATAVMAPHRDFSSEVAGKKETETLQTKKPKKTIKRSRDE